MIVPTQEVPKFPEVFEEADIAINLRALLTHDIPGFIIRHELEGIDPEVAFQVHNYTAELVHLALQQIHTSKVIEVSYIDEFHGKGQDKIGRLHRDVVPNYPMGDRRIDAARNAISRVSAHTEPFVNTTLSGGGDIFAALPGTHADKIASMYSAGLPLSQHPHSMLLAGYVNTELIHPRIYRDNVKPGDSVVLAASGKHASWHRYDTDHALGDRFVAVTELRDITDPQPNVKRRNPIYKAWEVRRKNGEFGFDLEESKAA